MAPLPVIVQAMRDLCDFADGHAYDTYEPDENPENQESYDDITKAVQIVTQYLKYK